MKLYIVSLLYSYTMIFIDKKNTKNGSYLMWHLFSHMSQCLILWGTVDYLISGHHWCRKFCPLVRGVHFLEGWLILVIFQSQRGWRGLIVHKKAFQTHEEMFVKKYLLEIWKKQNSKFLNTECFLQRK